MDNAIFSKYEEIIDSLNEVCMNPRAMSCSVCIFNTKKWDSGQLWCPPNEREAKRLYDIKRITQTKREAA
jgi:hypothetical protein